MTNFIRTFVFFISAGVVLTLTIAAQTGGIKGKVRTAKGAGIAGASVTARKDGVDVKSIKADLNGEFVLDGLETGRYNVAFEASGYSYGILYNVEINKNKIADLKNRLILTLDQGTQIFLKGSIFDKQGLSIAGATIAVESINSDGTTKPLGNTSTNVSGEFTFHPSAAASKLRVIATYKGLIASKDIEVNGPAIYRLAINLDINTRTSN
jgi:hypothetical protein